MNHVQEMLTNVLRGKQIPFKTVLLIDPWYASNKMVLFISGAQKVCAMRWYIEQFHREVKQLTGIEAYQCRKARIQRNHIACALLVWAQLNQKAKILRQTVYQLMQGLLKDCLINELRSPTISMGFA